MRATSGLMLKHFIIVAALILTFILCAAIVVVRHHGQPTLMWRPVSGHWTEADNIQSVLTYGRGDMEIAGQDSWRNYSFSGQLRFDLLFPETHYGDSGLVVRVKDATEGVDSYRGYYTGIRPDNRILTFGRADFGWHELKSIRLPHAIQSGTWYAMRVDVEGCDFTVTVKDPEQQVTTLRYTDVGCSHTGGVGLRSFYVRSSWRDIHVDLHP